MKLSAIPLLSVLRTAVCFGCSPIILANLRVSVGRWVNWFTLSGTDGLKSLPTGRSRRLLPFSTDVYRPAPPDAA